MGAVEYTPSSPNGNWTSLCQIAAQARSVGYAADRPNSEAGSDSTIPNFAYLRDLWEGEVDVPDIGALYKNNQTTYPTDFMNNPASYMAGTKYFDAASQWYPSQYSLPLTSTTDETQTANEAKQKQCATQITSMMKMNKNEKVASDGTAPTFGATVAESTAGTPGKFGYSYSAIDFPLWKVGFGSTDPVNQYIVPNGYCYANACFNDFAEVGTQPTCKGAEKLGELVQGHNMALVEADEACGRANAACAAPPATWNGAPAVMAACYGSDCTPEGILATTGVIPVA